MIFGLIYYILILILATPAVYLEFRNVKHNSLFVDIYTLTNIFAIICLVISLFFILLGWKLKRPDRVPSFFPGLMGVIIVAIVFIHASYRRLVYNAPTLFEAVRPQTKSQPESRLIFKKNNRLKVEEDHIWSYTNYYGSYRKMNDTFILDLPRESKLSGKAYIRNDSLFLDGDSFAFRVFGGH